LHNSKNEPNWKTKKQIADLTFKYPAFRTMDLTELTVLVDYLSSDSDVDVDAMLGHPSQFPIISQLADLVRQKIQYETAVDITYLNLCFYLTPKSLSRIIDFIRNATSTVDVKKMLLTLDELLDKAVSKYSRSYQVIISLLNVFTHPAVLSNLDYFNNNMNNSGDFDALNNAIRCCQSNQKPNTESNLELIAESNVESNTEPTPELNLELIPYLLDIVKLKSAMILFNDAYDFFEKFLPGQVLQPTSQQDLLAIQYLYNTISVFGKKMKCLPQQVMRDFFTEKVKKYARDIYLLVEEFKRLNMLTQKFVPIIFDYLCKNPEHAHKMANFLGEIRLLQEPSPRLYEEPWLRLIFEFDKFKEIIEENKECAIWLGQLLLPAEGLDRNTDTDSLAIYLKLALANFFPYKLPLLANDHPVVNNLISPFESYTLRELHYLHNSDDFKGKFLLIVKYGNSMTRLACANYLLKKISQLTRDDFVYNDTDEAATKKRNELLLLHDMIFEIVLNYPFEPSSNLLKKYIKNELMFSDIDQNKLWQMLLYYKYGRHPQFASFLHTFLAWTREQWEATVTSSMESKKLVGMSDHGVLEESTIATVENASVSLMDLDSPVGDQDVEMGDHELEITDITQSLMEVDNTNNIPPSEKNMEEETFVEVDAWQYFIFMVSLCSHLEKPAYDAGSSSKLTYDRDYEVLRVMRTGLRNYAEVENLQQQPLTNLIHWPKQAIPITEGVSEENIASFTEVAKLIPWQELYEISLGLPKISQKQYLEMLGCISDAGSTSQTQNISSKIQPFQPLPALYPIDLQTVYQLIMQSELQAELIVKYGTAKVMPFEVFLFMQSEEELCACLVIEEKQKQQADQDSHLIEGDNDELVVQDKKTVKAIFNETEIFLSIFESSDAEALKILNLKVVSEELVAESVVQKRSHEEMTSGTEEENSNTGIVSENTNIRSGNSDESDEPPQKRAKLSDHPEGQTIQTGASPGMFGHISAATTVVHAATSSGNKWESLAQNLSSDEVSSSDDIKGKGEVLKHDNIGEQRLSGASPRSSSNQYGSQFKIPSKKQQWDNINGTTNLVFRPQGG
jgi:hypothetical protein